MMYDEITFVFQTNETGSGAVSDIIGDDDEEKKNLTLSPAQLSAVGEQLKMIQNLVIQPSSPLCTAKPEPVDFDFYSFLGQWYQVGHFPSLLSIWAYYYAEPACSP